VIVAAKVLKLTATVLGQPPFPANEVHLWSARLDSPAWPSDERLPSAERERAARLGALNKRRWWVAARWALRGVLARYLKQEPAEIELRAGACGKPMLAEASPLRFNLSHSRGLALVAIAPGREVGVDVEWIDARRDVLRLAPRALDPAAAAAVVDASPQARSAVFHAAWTHREAVAKCLGCGLGGSHPELAVAVTRIDVAAGFAAALAVSGGEMPPLRHFSVRAA
jgi:4'-phosphopantetheinyl transferase